MKPVQLCYLFWSMSCLIVYHLTKQLIELNYRFREHRVGYQYESGQIIKVDSQFVHSEVVKPALSFLSDPIYKGANEEFLKAHEHYRKRRYKECLNATVSKHLKVASKQFVKKEGGTTILKRLLPRI